MREVNLSEIVERLKREGAGNGDVRISLIWNTTDDLDLHVVTPFGETISFCNRRSRCGGLLDVDMNRDDFKVTNAPVENVFWPEGKAPEGRYEVKVHLYKRRTPSSDIPFQVRIQDRGIVRMLPGTVSMQVRSVTVEKFDSKVTISPLSMNVGGLFDGTFCLNIEVLDVTDKPKMMNFLNTVLSSTGACQRSQFTSSQLAELSRLQKILERMDDQQNYLPERQNAARLLHRCLEQLELDESTLRAACGGLSGSDSRRPARATLEFTKKITSRREWFEENAEAIAHPMGVAVSVNKAQGHFGRVGHNGVTLVGTPPAVVLASVFIANTSEKALKSCNKSDVDTFCGNFCKQVRPTDYSDPDGRRDHLSRSFEWLEKRFGGGDSTAEWNTPKRYRRNTPTAFLGRESGEKRKAEFETMTSMATKHHVRALTY